MSPEKGKTVGDDVASKGGNRKKRWLKIVGITAAVLVVVAGAGFWYITQPSAVVELTESTSLASREKNTDVMAALVLAGVDDVLVDVNDERTYVGYEIPTPDQESNATADPNATAEPVGIDETYASFVQRLVVFTAANAAPESPSIMVLQYLDGNARLFWVVPTHIALAYAAGEIEDSEFMDSITETRYA